MDTSQNTPVQTSSPNSRARLLPYTLGLIGAMLAIQIVIALTGDPIRALLAGSWFGATLVMSALWGLGLLLHLLGSVLGRGWED